MSTKDDSSSNDGILYFIIFGGCALFLMKLYEKVEPKIIFFWHAHRTRIFGVGALLTLTAIFFIVTYLWNRFHELTYKKAITSKDSTAISLGVDSTGATQFMRQVFRTSHTQVIGTTSCGKTESVILPWIIQDIKNGSGILIIDGKSDSQFLDKLYSYVVAAGRQKDFRLLSLAKIAESSSFNPLQNGSPQEVVERVFSSFSFENEYYRNVQYTILLSIVRLIHERNQIPTFHLVHRLLTDTARLKLWLQHCKDEELQRDLTLFNEGSSREKAEKTSGLAAHLTHFASGELAVLFNSENPGINFDEGLNKGHIYYFQLPTMYYPFLAEVTGKLVLQSLQSAIAKRHLGLTEKPEFYACYLDDFQDYIYEGFGALLNKSRSGNIGMVFSHQALGDLDKVSKSFRDVVLTNTNIKIVMRNNDPDTCDHFARSFGTKTTKKVTERNVSGFFGDTRTGEKSVREVEEFIFHPNVIKQLHVGEGIVTVPHPRGVKIMKIRFQRRPDRPPCKLPVIPKKLAPIPTLTNEEPGSTKTV